jgi:DNA-binding response OmpR family regulator
MSEPMSRADSTNDEGRPAHLLVVEDDPRIAAVLVKGLRTQGFQVESVATGAEAIRRASDFDVLLLDLGLPDIDGLDVLRALRDDGVGVPVVVITARTDPRDRAAAADLGADFYLTKPFAWTAVWAAVRVCLTAPDRS